MTQCELILRHLQRKPITAIEALARYQCFRLAARVRDLRADGHEIKSKQIKTKSGKCIAQYYIGEPNA